MYPEIDWDLLAKYLETHFNISEDDARKFAVEIVNNAERRP
jgi:hypothetical protein